MRHSLFGKPYFRAAAAALLCALVLLPSAGCAEAGKVLSDTASAVLSELPTSSQVSSAAAVIFDPPDPSGAEDQASALSSSAVQRTESSAPTVKKIEPDSDSGSIKKLTVSKAAAPAASYGFVSQRSNYDSLSSDAERTLYSLIGQSVYQIAVQKNSSGYYPMGQISVQGHISEAQIRVTLMAYENDNPQVFWAANAYSYGYQNGETVLQMYSMLSQADCTKAVQTFNAAVQKVVSAIPKGLNQFDREEYLFNYLTSRCTYSDAAAADASIWQAYTAYGALTDGKVVCEGYSRAMELLSSYAGLQCALIRGTGEDGAPHMWNAIDIGGNWYNLDVTWSDSNIVYYNYFNIPDSVLKQTHGISPSVSALTDQQICVQDAQYNLFAPSCTATAENYFRVKGIPVQTLGRSGDSAVVQALVPKLKAGTATLAFSIGDKLNYDDTIGGLLTASPYKMSAYLAQAAEQAGKKLNMKQITYVSDEADRGLNVHVAYQ